MANCQIFRLPEIEVSSSNLRHALNIILHSICLCRALGPIAPRPVFLADSKYKIGFSKCSSQEVDDAIDFMIKRFSQEPKRYVGPDLEQGELMISFYRLIKNTSLFGLTTVEERVYWERWIIPLVICKKTVDDQIEETAVKDMILHIVTLVNEKSDHLPPPPTRTAIYPFEITISNSLIKNDSQQQQSLQRHNSTTTTTDIASSLTNLGGGLFFGVSGGTHAT
jgi:hypothetical protein